jgi:long-chain fatty acid transport protein
LTIPLFWAAEKFGFKGDFMKKTLLLLSLSLALVGLAQAAIVTNTNQSAAYIRLLARNASMDIDAVYYNPAGLMKLKNGFHVYLSNQTINQTKTIVNDFPLLNAHTFKGEVKVPVYPDAYVVWKQDKLALSFGFGPNAGGGSAEFKTGLPSFEVPISQIPASLSAKGLPTNKYSADIFFKGSSIYLGFQANASYALSEMFSLAAGFRYIAATNTYEGYLNNVKVNPAHPLLNPTGGLMSAVTLFTALGDTATAALVANKSVDVKQTGTGFTPILSLHATPVPELNLSLRYEFNTKLELTNETAVDGTGLFPNGLKTGNDIPAILAFGADYAISPQFRAMLSGTMYFDKSADWDGREALVDKNSYEVALGLEYDITEMITVSAGYMLTKYGVTPAYQSDQSHILDANTVGFGGRLRLSPKLNLDLAALIANYKDTSRQITYAPFGTYRELYQRTTFDFSVGIGYRFGGEIE